MEPTKCHSANFPIIEIIVIRGKGLPNPHLMEIAPILATTKMPVST